MKQNLPKKRFYFFKCDEIFNFLVWLIGFTFKKPKHLSVKRRSCRFFGHRRANENLCDARALREKFLATFFRFLFINSTKMCCYKNILSPSTLQSPIGESQITQFVYRSVRLSTYLPTFYNSTTLVRRAIDRLYGYITLHGNEIALIHCTRSLAFSLASLQIITRRYISLIIGSERERRRNISPDI